MRLEITRLEGLRNDLLLRVERAEIEATVLSVANRDRLMSLPGIPRHRAATASEKRRFAAATWPLTITSPPGDGVDGSGPARKRAIAISNRNLGANHGHLAWQRDASPRILHVLDDPLDQARPGLAVASDRDGGDREYADWIVETSAFRAAQTAGT